MRKPPRIMRGAALQSASPQPVHQPRPATAFRTEVHWGSTGGNGGSGQLEFTNGAETSVRHTGFVGSEPSMVRRFAP